jgi:hypothetical protein
MFRSQDRCAAITTTVNDCAQPGIGEPTKKPSYESVLSDAVQNHLITTHKGSGSVYYTAPREMLVLSSLSSSLDIPMTKRLRRSQFEDDLAPDCDIEVGEDVSSRVCFRVVFLNPRDKKTLQVPVGAGGGITQHGVAITIHKEIAGITTQHGDSLVVGESASASQELRGHFILGGFSSSSAARLKDEALDCVHPIAPDKSHEGGDHSKLAHRLVFSPHLEAGVFGLYVNVVRGRALSPVRHSCRLKLFG